MKQQVVDSLTLFVDKSPRRILLVTGRDSYEQSGAKQAIEQWIQHLRTEIYHIAASPNPDYATAHEAALLIQQHNCDMVIGIGGGSAIDTAKAARLLAGQADMSEERVKQNRFDRAPELDFIAIPTTAGSGAEATPFAVVYIDGIKYSISHPAATANVVVLDPSFLRTNTPHLAATAGIDAVCQAIESYWSVQSTPKSRRYSLQALEYLLPSIDQAVLHPTDAVRLHMLRGAHLAGQAIAIAKTTAPHALSYGLTVRYGVDHGEAVGMSMPYFLQYNADVTKLDCIDPRGATYVRRRIDEIVGLLGADTSERAAMKFRVLLERIGLRSYVATEQPESERHLLTKTVNAERLANNPRRVQSAAVARLLDELVK
jgi:alcohol dehydrogenase